MAYKTILFCLNEISEMPRLMALARQLASDHKAHVRGLYVIPAVQIYPSAGLASVAESLGTEAYARVRIGVGRGESEQVLADHVLSGFEPDESEALAAALERACDASLTWAREGIVSAMNRFNARPREARENTPEGER